ncbi:retrovirus-related Pol polyprotein from type-1 retrotransposable element R2 [Caerostris extrusa]|uniref:Retrovirus-related Pol polyprotein from type-1 retrotransposable element R2 n=1 Tax=Caerostris extrusa TaxID=172846 RepID=A0AAV4X356_CAEEX|nr:retrovirus-related Pol polyprotein from type-1 retrotransposable element R2 [Caerostris extrusa]
MLRKEIKHTLSIPDSAANEYLYGHRKHGCMAIPIAAEESDLNAIDSAFKLLTSRDERLREIVVEHLSQTVRPGGRLNVEWVFEDNIPRLIYQDLILKTATAEACSIQY